MAMAAFALFCVGLLAIVLTAWVCVLITQEVRRML